jgi:hypothetical protein
MLNKNNVKATLVLTEGEMMGKLSTDWHWFGECSREMLIVARAGLTMLLEQPTYVEVPDAPQE